MAAASLAGWTHCAACPASAAIRPGLSSLSPSTSRNRSWRPTPAACSAACWPGRAIPPRRLGRSSAGPRPPRSCRGGRRPLQPGAHGAGQRGMPARAAALRRLPGGIALPGESRGVAVADSAPEGQAGDSCGARRPWSSAAAAACSWSSARKGALGRALGLSPLSAGRCRCDSASDGQAIDRRRPPADRRSGPPGATLADLQARRHATSALRWSATRPSTCRPPGARSKPPPCAGCGRMNWTAIPFDHRPEAGAADRRGMKAGTTVVYRNSTRRSSEGLAARIAPTNSSASLICRWISSRWSW